MIDAAALTALFKVVIPLAIITLILARVANAGADRANKKILEIEKKDHDEFHKRGEEWDGMGGLVGIVRRRMRS